MPYKDKETRQRHDAVNAIVIGVRRARYRSKNRQAINQHAIRYYLANTAIIKSRIAKYYIKNMETIKPKRSIQHAESHRTLKLEIFTHYGLKCELCNETRLGALNIDHIFGGGRQHAVGSKLYKWLKMIFIKTGNWPTGFRTLCANHNWKEHLKNLPQLSMTNKAISRRERDIQIKLGIMLILGEAACIECGCTDLDILDIHHPNGDGAEHRREISNNKSGNKFYRALFKLDDFTRLLMCSCRSCNSNAAFGRY